MPRTRPVRRLVATTVALTCAGVGLVAAGGSPALAGGQGSRSDATAVGLRWYDATSAAVSASGQPEQSTQNRIWAISWLAAARAVQQRGNDTFQTAAFASALHDSLSSLAPSQKGSLDSRLSDTLSSLPDGPQKSAGVRAGQAAASQALAERSGDGLATVQEVNRAWTPPPAAPGVWQPTPPSYGPSIRNGLTTAKPFLLTSNSQFRVGPPPALTSKAYLDALTEIHAVGSATSSVRTQAQTDVADFIAASSISVYAQALRQVIAQEGKDLAWQSRLVAVFNAVEIDQQIAVYDSKYAYVHWRPVTAIRTGSVDQDPNWTPLLASPSHPEYPSGHTGYAGTAQAVLTALVGPRPLAPVQLTSSTSGTTRSYSDWASLTQDTVDGRVWEGVHFRFSDEVGRDVGQRVAAYDLQHLSGLGLTDTDD